MNGDDSMSYGQWSTPPPNETMDMTAAPTTAESPQTFQNGFWYRTVVPIMLACCVVAFFTNLFILVSVHWMRRGLSPTLIFSISLAVADAFAALVFGTGLLINSLLPVGYGIEIHDVCARLTLEGFRMGGLLVSILHLLLLAVNHYIGIVRPLHYASTMTKGNALLAISLLWLLPLAFVFIYFGSVPGDGFQAPACSSVTFFLRRKFRLLVGGLILGPLALMFVMYAHIFAIVLRHNRGLQRFQGSCHFRHSVKAAVTTLVIIGTYTVGYVPAVLVYVVRCQDCAIPLSAETEVLFFYLYSVTNTLMVLKVLVNPIIYAARMKDVRLALERMAAACLPCAARVAHFAADDSNSSFVRSRNDSMYTSIRLQSVYSRTAGASDSPMLVYQKTGDQTYRNGRVSHEPRQNGIDKKPATAS